MSLGLRSDAAAVGVARTRGKRGKRAGHGTGYGSDDLTARRSWPRGTSRALEISPRHPRCGRRVTRYVTPRGRVEALRYSRPPDRKARPGCITSYGRPATRGSST